MIVGFILRAVLAFLGQGDKVHYAMNHSKDQEDKYHITQAYILHDSSFKTRLLNV